MLAQLAYIQSACQGLLGALPAEEIANRFEQNLERARILAAGALIIQVAMEYMHINEIHVSSQGVREGALLAYARYGDGWLEEVNRIASRRQASPAEQDTRETREEQQRPFAETGRDIMPGYAKKFLKWPDDIRKEQDTEPVHKMRVASRRLRAYQQSVAGEEQEEGVRWLIDRLNGYHQQEKQALDAELAALDENALRQQVDSCIPKGAAQHGKS